MSVLRWIVWFCAVLPLASQPAPSPPAASPAKIFARGAHNAWIPVNLTTPVTPFCFVDFRSVNPVEYRFADGDPTNEATVHTSRVLQLRVNHTVGMNRLSVLVRVSNPGATATCEAVDTFLNTITLDLEDAKPTPSVEPSAPRVRRGIPTMLTLSGLDRDCTPNIKNITVSPPVHGELFLWDGACSFPQSDACFGLSGSPCAPITAPTVVNGPIVRLAHVAKLDSSFDTDTFGFSVTDAYTSSDMSNVSLQISDLPLEATPVAGRFKVALNKYSYSLTVLAANASAFADHPLKVTFTVPADLTLGPVALQDGKFAANVTVPAQSSPDENHLTYSVADCSGHNASGPLTITFEDWPYTQLHGSGEDVAKVLEALLEQLPEDVKTQGFQYEEQHSTGDIHSYKVRGKGLAELFSGRITITKTAHTVTPEPVQAPAPVPPRTHTPTPGLPKAPVVPTEEPTVELPVPVTVPSPVPEPQAPPAEVPQPPQAPLEAVPLSFSGQGVVKIHFPKPARVEQPTQGKVCVVGSCPPPAETIASDWEFTPAATLPLVRADFSYTLVENGQTSNKENVTVISFTTYSSELSVCGINWVDQEFVVLAVYPEVSAEAVAILTHVDEGMTVKQDNTVLCKNSLFDPRKNLTFMPQRVTSKAELRAKLGFPRQREATSSFDGCSPATVEFPERNFFFSEEFGVTARRMKEGFDVFASCGGSQQLCRTGVEMPCFIPLEDRVVFAPSPKSCNGSSTVKLRSSKYYYSWVKDATLSIGDDTGSETESKGPLAFNLTVLGDEGVLNVTVNDGEDTIVCLVRVSSKPPPKSSGGHRLLLAFLVVLAVGGGAAYWKRAELMAYAHGFAPLAFAAPNADDLEAGRRAAAMEMPQVTPRSSEIRVTPPSAPPSRPPAAPAVQPTAAAPVTKQPAVSTAKPPAAPAAQALPKASPTQQVGAPASAWQSGWDELSDIDKDD
eukprot:TRINITY_DN4148_c0_g1_i1.p1 TRINITY_DN4148_c0_g1~~TRINITY_DN4148_c0_g1_i1.p1  ORF type:complete len:973 (-),score=117.38 TRINITY_DN4148_c0_g1_i1:46-2919(-)